MAARNLWNSNNLISAKLEPAHSSSPWVERNQLLGLIDSSLTRKLTLILAPAGSGKTTALNQWYRKKNTAYSIAWLSLDQDDNDPVHFFSYLIASVRHAVEDFAAYMSSQLDEVSVPKNLIANVFLDSLGKIKRDMVIMLDDFQFISHPAILDTFAYLLKHTPPNIHWLLSSRYMPDLKLTELKLQDALFVIDVEDLRFEAQDISQLNQQINGKSLSVEDADYLHNRTEGWVAGVKLALLSANDKVHPGDSLKKFNGYDVHVVKYLADAILSEQPVEVQSFLIVSSLVDEINSGLCNALLGITDSQAILEKLAQAQLFIQPLDNYQQWYRYHSIFLDFLRSRLHRDYSDQLADLHKTASHWFADNGMWQDSLEHAFASGDKTWATELLGRCTVEWMRQGEVTQILSWTQRLSIEEIINAPTVCLNYIASLSYARHFDQANELLRRFKAQTQLLESHDSETSNKNNSAIYIMKMVLTTLQNDDVEVADITPEDLLITDDEDGFLRGTLMNAVAYGLLNTSKFDQARRLAMQARDLLISTNNIHALGFSETLISLADRAQGRLKEAAMIAEQSYARLEESGRSSAWVNAATSLSLLRYEQNRLEESEALCIEILPLLTAASTIENLSTAYIVLARVKSIKGKHSEALQLLDYLHSVLERGHYKRFLAQVCYEKLRIHLLRNDMRSAESIATDFNLIQRWQAGEWSQDCEYERGWERAGFSIATFLKAQGKIREALAIFQKLCEKVRTVGRIHREVSLHANIATCYWELDDKTHAWQALNQGLGVSYRHAFSRSIYDEAPGVDAVLACAVSAGKLTNVLPQNYFKRFQNIFMPLENILVQHQTKGPLRGLPLEPLTEREMHMLKLLSMGLSNKEISLRSEVALSTAKWHLKNIFAKLNVSTRTEALVRAQELRLFERASEGQQLWHMEDKRAAGQDHRPPTDNKKDS